MGTGSSTGKTAIAPTGINPLRATGGVDTSGNAAHCDPSWAPAVDRKRSCASQFTWPRRGGHLARESRWDDR